MRAHHMLAWAHRVFGETALRRDERALRFAEEALELAQAEGVGRETMLRLVERVWSRPSGDRVREFDQACATLETYGALAGLTVEGGAMREWMRVQSLDENDLRRRHEIKVGQGIATGEVK